MAYCPACGTEAGESANFCHECGSALSTPPPEQQRVSGGQTRGDSRERSPERDDRHWVDRPLTDLVSGVPLATAIGGAGMILSLLLPWVRVDPAADAPIAMALGLQTSSTLMFGLGFGLLFLLVAFVGSWHWVKTGLTLLLGGILSFTVITTITSGDEVTGPHPSGTFGDFDVGGYAVSSAHTEAGIGVAVFALCSLLVFLAGLARFSLALSKRF